jgi:hypothetical protein
MPEYPLRSAGFGPAVAKGGVHAMECCHARRHYSVYVDASLYPHLLRDLIVGDIFLFFYCCNYFFAHSQAR